MQGEGVGACKKGGQISQGQAGELAGEIGVMREEAETEGGKAGGHLLRNAAKAEEADGGVGKAFQRFGDADGGPVAFAD